MNRNAIAVALAIVAGQSLMLGAAALADEEADHAALRALVTEYESAVQKADPSLLKPHLAAGFTGVMVTGEEVNSFDSIEAYWRRIQGLLGNGGTYRVKVNVPEPATIVGDVAYAHGTTEDTAVTSSGNEYQFQGFWTAVCTREGDGWKIARIHGSMDAIGNTFVASALKAASTTAAIAGGLIGLVIGALLLWVLGRSRRSAKNVTGS